MFTMDESPPVGGFPLAVPLDTINANLATASVERIILTVCGVWSLTVGATIRMRLWKSFGVPLRFQTGVGGVDLD